MLASMLFSCTKKSGTLTIQIKPIVNGQPLELNSKYKSLPGKWFKAEKLKFYVSDLAITVARQSFPLKEVILADLSNPASLSYTFSGFDDIEISNVTFGLGLKPSLNNPSKSNDYDLGQFEDANPLSGSQNMYWGMTSDYRFFLYEGRSDTSASQTNADSQYRSFQYHIGKDKFYRDVSTINKPYRLKQGEDNTLIVLLDLDKMFDSGTDKIDLGVENATEAIGPIEEALAEKLSNNLQKAFSIE